MAFPIQQNNIFNQNRLAREGWAYAFGTVFSGAIAASPETSLTGTPTVPLGQALVINNIRVFAQTTTPGTAVPPLRLRVRIFDAVTGSATYEFTGPIQYISNGGEIRFNEPWIIPSGKSISILAQEGDGATTWKISLSVTGTMIANDLDFTAPGRALIVWDSIGKNTSVPYTIRQDQVWQYLLRDGLTTTRGIKYQIINKSLSGKTGIDFDKVMAEGMLDVEGVTDIFWGLGVNDAIQATGTSAFGTAVTNFINYKKKYFPKVRLYMCGATPLQNNTTEATLATYRTAMSNAVSTAADPLVKYINLANSFDRTVDGNYASTDTPGSKIHPASVTAHAGIANTLIAGL